MCARLENLESAALSQQPAAIASCAPRTEQDLKDTSKLPDSVKDLPTFNGDPTHYMSWIHQVETILADYSIVKGKPIYRAILNHIRRKVQGQADQALISYNIFNEEWREIKECLSLDYADKRDIRSLEFELGGLHQGKLSVDEFYAKVNHQLSLIINKVKTESHSRETVTALIESYRNRALDVFIRGLRGEISKLLKFQKPKNLPEAYAACLDFQNINYRDYTLHTVNDNYTISSPINQMTRKDNLYVPPRQDKKYIPVNKILPREQNQIYNSIHNRNTSNPPPRPTQPKPPVPMEVDPSLKSARINYMNRPTPVVRLSNQSSNLPRKQQRVYNIVTRDDSEEELEEEHYLKEAEKLSEHEEYSLPSPDYVPNTPPYEANFMTQASPAYPT